MYQFVDCREVENVGGLTVKNNLLYMEKVKLE